MCILLILLSSVTMSFDTLEVSYIGNAAFQLSDGETTLLLDYPYESGAFGSPSYDFNSVHPSGRPVSLITHGHADHWDQGLFQETDWQVVGPSEITTGLTPSRFLPLADSVFVGSFQILPFPTTHGDMEHYAYLVIWNGRRLYFSGDTEDPTTFLSMEGVDVAFLTPWLMCTLAEARQDFSRTKMVLQHHWEGADQEVCLQPTILSQGNSFLLLPEGS
jgi:L-ascorbate metabolism protein UlaG (beta-lactamase superfamily)